MYLPSGQEGFYNLLAIWWWDNKGLSNNGNIDMPSWLLYDNITFTEFMDQYSSSEYIHFSVISFTFTGLASILLFDLSWAGF